MVSVSTASDARPHRRAGSRRATRPAVPAVRGQGRELGAASRAEFERRRALIAQLPLFSGLAGGILDALAAKAQLRRVAQADYVVRCGEAGHELFAVVFGQVQLVFGEPGNEPGVLALIGPGNTFGEAAMWLEIEYPVSVRATQDTLLIAVPRDVLEPLVLRHPELSMRLLTCISRRFHNLVTNLGSHKQKSGEQRLAAYLLGLPNLNGDALQPRVKLPASKGTIASLVSIQPETLSRILRRFSENGWIEMRGRELTITRADALRTMSDAPAMHRH